MQIWVRIQITFIVGLGMFGRTIEPTNLLSFSGLYSLIPIWSSTVSLNFLSFLEVNISLMASFSCDAGILLILLFK